jgi:hypothetical protein
LPQIDLELAENQIDLTCLFFVQTFNIPTLKIPEIPGEVVVGKIFIPIVNIRIVI